MLQTNNLKEALDNSQYWPIYPILCVKRYQKNNNWPECGLVVDSEKAKYTVFLVNLYELNEKYKNFQKMFYDCPQYKYNSADEMTQAGWMVD